MILAHFAQLFILSEFDSVAKPSVSGFSDIVFGNPTWIPGVIAAGIVIALLTLASYRKSAMPLPLKAIAIGLRLCGIALLLLCLLEPLATTETPKPQANIFAVMVDKSESVNVLLQDRTPDERTQITEQLSESAEWQRTLADDFRLRRYVFDSNIEPVDSFDGLKFAGNESSIYGSLRSLTDRFAGRPLAGIVLITDGRATDGKPDQSLSSLGIPVYPVHLGNLSNTKDIQISTITTRQSDFETAPVTIQATVVQKGFDGEKIRVRLLGKNNKVIQTQTLSSKPNGAPMSVEFQFRPEESGVQGFQIEATAESEANVVAASDSTAIRATKEITLRNNSRYQVVDRGHGPYRILYIAGRPNWEFKFLKRALEEDDEIQLTALIRIARKEPKFNFRDSKVDSANPLFSGFEDALPEEKEQYDEPVFARLGLTETNQLKRGFPKDAEELFDYHAIIIDDIEHDFFTAEQQSLIRQFVSIRGGGLLALGGQESLRGKGFRNSVLGQLLPIYGEDGITDLTQPLSNSTPSNLPSIAAGGKSSVNQNADNVVRFQLSREGWLQPFLRLAENEAAEQKRLEGMPPFEVINRVGGTKPGASVLVEGLAPDDSRVPVLATQRFGSGRTAAFMIGDLWRWGLRNEGPKESPLGQSWRQMVRWLIADVPKAIQMRVAPLKDSSRTFRITTSVKDSSFQVADNAQVSVTITSPKGTSTTALCEPSTNEVGEYEATIVAEEEGVYTATAEVKSIEGTSMGSAQTGWVYEPSAKELQSIGDDKNTLEQIASETGGEVIAWDALDGFVSQLPSKKVPVMETRVIPLWHQTWVLLAAITFVCVEWGMRRRYGLS